MLSVMIYGLMFISQTNDEVVCPPGAFSDYETLASEAILSNPELKVALEKLSRSDDFISQMRGSIELRRLVLKEPLRSASPTIRKSIQQQLREIQNQFQKVDAQGNANPRHSVSGLVYTSDALKIVDAWIDGEVLPSDEMRFSTQLVSNREIESSRGSFKKWSDVATQSDLYFSSTFKMDSYSMSRMRDRIRDGLPVRINVPFFDPQTRRQGSRTFVVSGLKASPDNKNFELYAFEANQSQKGLWKLERAAGGFRLLSKDEDFRFNEASMSFIDKEKNKNAMRAKDPLVLLAPLAWDDPREQSGIEVVEPRKSRAKSDR